MPAMMQTPAEFPIQRRSVMWGLWAAMSVGLAFMSPLAGFTTLVLFVAVGALWRRGEPPILAFCIGYQWVFIATGYFYQQIAGSYPGLPLVGDLDGAALLSLVGLLTVVAGIRTGLFFLRRRFLSREKKLQESKPRYDVQRLFRWVIACYTISWLVQVSPMDIQFNTAQFIYRMLEFRSIFFFLLFLVIFQEQKGYRYGAIAFAYVLIPSFASEMSDFKEVFILVFIALLSEWQPWSKSVAERRRSVRIAWTGAGVTAALLALGLIWEGGVKHIWRSKITAGAVTGSPTDKLEAFGPIVQGAIPGLAWDEAAESLAGRLSSGLGYFSLVLEQVPKLLPHENGSLTLRALEHTFKPRFLFPDKPNLGSDSWLVQQYAGVYTAGEETGTSIGLGYMAEFYIDFGILGMFIPIFLYGFILGLMYEGLLLFSPSRNFSASAITIILGQHFMSFEGEIAKLMGGLVQAFLVFAVLIYFIGPWLHRKLLVRLLPRLIPKGLPTT